MGKSAQGWGPGVSRLAETGQESTRHSWEVLMTLSLSRMSPVVSKETTHQFNKKEQHFLQVSSTDQGGRTQPLLPLWKDALWILSCAFEVSFESLRSFGGSGAALQRDAP